MGKAGDSAGLIVKHFDSPRSAGKRLGFDSILSLLQIYISIERDGAKSLSITKTYPYNVYHFIPNFYIAKLEYAGVYLFFLFFLGEAVLTCTLNPCFEQK